MSNLIEKAVIAKLRFPYKGLQSVEGLFDLNSDVLKSIGETMEQQSVSTVKTSRYSNAKSEEQKLDDLKHEVLQYIIGIKEAAELAKRNYAETTKELAIEKEMALQAKMKLKGSKFDNMTEAELDAILAK